MRFNKKYKVYLDVGEGYEEIFVSDIGRFMYEREDGQYFWRYKWGEVTFSNNPKESSELDENEFKGYDLISEAGYFQEIKIKYVDSERTIEGYFSHKDCQFKSGKHFKIIRVKPATLDEYTPLLENWEEEVGIIGGEIVSNANFGKGYELINYNNFEHPLPVKIKSSNIQQTKTVNSFTNPDENKFLYKVTKGYILDIDISIKMTVDFVESYSIYIKKYDSSLTQISSELVSTRAIGLTFVNHEVRITEKTSLSISQGESASIYIVATGQDNILNPSFIRYDSINVSVSGNPINVSTKEITVQFNERNLVNYKRWGIDSYAYKLIRLSDRPNLEDYFEDSGSETPFAPKSSYFGSLEYGMQEKSTGLYLYESQDGEGIVDILGAEDWELSEVTVWRGDTIRKWFRKEVYYWCTCVFSREEVITKDKNGEPVDPNPEGEWHIRESAPDGKVGYTLWTRLPYNGVYKEWTLGNEVIADGDPYEHNGYFKWSNKLTSKRNYPTEDTVESFGNAIDFYTLIKYIYNNTAYPSGDVKSTFLWNDYEEDVPILQEGENYVTNSKNYFNDTVVLPTINLKENIDTTEDSSKLELSFKDFMEDFRNFFKVTGQGNLYWFIQYNPSTEEYDLRIEHIKFLDKSSGIYITTNLIEDSTYQKYLEETYNYSFDDSDMFRKFTIEAVNSGYKGFKENIVSFEKIVTNSRNKDLNLEHQTKIFSTDIQYAKENPNDLENGLIWLNIDSNDEVIRDKTSKNNTTEMPNGYFATSNFLEKGFMRYEGVWETGTINGVSGKDFEKTLRNLMCEDFSIPNLHSSEFFQTGIGRGMTESLELDPERQITQLKLAFRKIDAPADISLKSGETTSLDGFYLMVQKESDFEGAENIYFDFGNYEN